MTHNLQANGVGKRHMPCVNKVPKQTKTNKQNAVFAGMPRFCKDRKWRIGGYLQVW
jgi:hypothetical protein